MPSTSTTLGAAALLLALGVLVPSAQAVTLQAANYLTPDCSGPAVGWEVRPGQTQALCDSGNGQCLQLGTGSMRASCIQGDDMLKFPGFPVDAYMIYEDQTASSTCSTLAGGIAIPATISSTLACQNFLMISSSSGTVSLSARWDNSTASIVLFPLTGDCTGVSTTITTKCAPFTTGTATGYYGFVKASTSNALTIPAKSGAVPKVASNAMLAAVVAGGVGAAVFAM
ncbi:hypothetical protein HKX48_006075 [Thoreauomyces humboldtii]|nr:hypothetical protein HKX48_006075 [Thoreauomyces humboldtii]